MTVEQERTSYSIGYQVGGDLDRQRVEVRPEILLQGIQDALGDQPLAMSPIEMHQNMVELQNKVEAEEEKTARSTPGRIRTKRQAFPNRIIQI